MVMNRLSTTNLIEPVTEKLEFQDQTPFLLYRNGKDDIYGIWFYEEKNCAKIFKLISSLLQLVLTKSDKSSNIRQRSFSESHRKHQKQGNAQMDIISLLTRAQDEYDKKSAAKDSSKSSQRSPNGDIVKPTPVRINGETITPSNTAPLTLGMLFAQAGGVAKKPNEDPKDFDSRVRSFTANGCNNLSNHAGMSTETILQNLLSNSAHTLHHIERQVSEIVKSNTEKSCIERPLSAGDATFTAESLEKDLKERLNILPKTDNVNKELIMGKCDLSCGIAKSQPIDIPILTPAMLDSSLHSSVPPVNIKSFAEKTDTFLENCSSSFPVINESRSYSPTQLLSPMDFTIPRRQKNIQQTLLSSSYSPEPVSATKNGFGNSNEDLLHPQALINGPLLSRSLSSGKPPTVTPLNKDQFKEALMFMIQSDDDFVMQLHECYLKSLKSQLSVLHFS
uniref:mRNA-decapping enzyme 1B n=1 Tax=Parasteatoda tepidariorum TaxID=114398 RepID=A0A2L2YR25_PARTP